ncbi:unnamed protein product [Protopolystoma xenopodis]|uniref:Uncharacterized protein n=1 Tax=Protopolystoma xenopodis TaxID=117903 RepID=A0A448WYR8_9PLAT|nr:unnamed protein product [Protopolystoma xenopodis]
MKCGLDVQPVRRCMTPLLPLQTKPKCSRTFNRLSWPRSTEAVSTRTNSTRPQTGRLHLAPEAEPGSDDLLETANRRVASGVGDAPIRRLVPVASVGVPPERLATSAGWPEAPT